MSTLLISINRTSLSLGPLVLSGSNDANPIGITDYTEPAMLRRTTYAPESAYEHGSTPLASVWQQTILGFEVSTTEAATEAASRLLIAELLAAVSQFSFTVAVAVDGAPTETWACNPGSMQPAGSRTFSDLLRHNPVWSVTIPAHPVRTIA